MLMLGDDYELTMCIEVHVVTIDVYPHHPAWLGWEPRDDHARPWWIVTLSGPKCPLSDNSTLLAWPLPTVPSDPEHINITAINTDALTEAWATVTMPDWK